jgi:hypothetical protein
MATDYTQMMQAQAMANMSDPDKAAYLEQQQKQKRTGAAITGAAGIADVIGGSMAQNQAEGDIDMYGAESDSIKEQMKNLKAPGAMDSETVAAAVRNATILGSGKPQEDSSQLAAAKMAMDSGADATKVQRALTEAEAQKDMRDQSEQQGAFREGLGYAQQDANADYQQEMGNLGMDYDESQRALQMAQQESLMGQQQKQGGIKNAIGSGVNYLQSGGMDQIKGLFGGEGEDTAANTTAGGGEENTFLTQTGGLDGDPTTPFAQGGVVQKTPGAFKHDDGDGVYEEGENEMILMAQKAGGLVDTGIRQTGGEFVINPEQAKGMELAYDKINKKKNPSRQDLMALYEAVRFLDEPQFD